MKNQAKEVVTQFLSAVQNGDNQKLAELLHPKIEWSQPGDNQLSGTKQSAAEVFDMVGKMNLFSGYKSLDSKSIISPFIDTVKDP